MKKYSLKLAGIVLLFSIDSLVRKQHMPRIVILTLLFLIGYPVSSNASG